MEDGSSEVGSLEVGSSEVGSSEVGSLEIEASTIFLGYAGLCAPEYIQDRLDISSRAVWIERRGRRGAQRVLPNVSREDCHNRAVIPFGRVPSDPFERVDAT